MSKVEHLIIAENEFNKIIAFMGTENNRLEMLFICLAERGKGIGKQLLKYGIDLPLMRRNVINPHAVKKHVAGGRLLKAADDTERRRLAAARRAEQSQKLLVSNI